MTSTFRQTRYQGRSMDVKPSEVTAVLREAGVRRWVLMGLHGYVGYLPEPRATQDVDVLVDHDDRAAAVAAIEDRWPTLEVRASEVVVRFMDPGELDADGRSKPVIDVMLPWSHLHAEVLKSQVVVDEATDDRVPTLEAALAAKYAAMVSPNRQPAKKAFDAGDFRNLVLSNADQIDSEELVRLAELVWEGATDDILDLLDAAKTDRPFEL